MVVVVMVSCGDCWWLLWLVVNGGRLCVGVVVLRERREERERETEINIKIRWLWWWCWCWFLVVAVGCYCGCGSGIDRTHAVIKLISVAS